MYSATVTGPVARSLSSRCRSMGVARLGPSASGRPPAPEEGRAAAAGAVGRGDGVGGCQPGGSGPAAPRGEGKGGVTVLPREAAVAAGAQDGGEERTAHGHGDHGTGARPSSSCTPGPGRSLAALCPVACVRAGHGLRVSRDGRRTEEFA